MPTKHVLPLQFQSQMGNECINIALGEGRQPKSILNDEFFEERSFPHFFPTGKFEYEVKKKQFETSEIFQPKSFTF